MEQYLTFTDQVFWEVIVNGDLVSSVASASAEGLIHPKISEQKLAKKNELKAKSTLMLAILNEHLLKFHTCKDEKSLCKAIKNRFGGNKESKKMQRPFSSRIIKTLLHQVKKDWIKPMIDNTSSTNETVNTAHGVSATSSMDQASTASYDDYDMFSFFSNQSNAPQLDNEDLEQIDTDDLEEMDLKWQVAMLTIRVKRFINKTGRELDLNGKETVVFDMTNVKCYNCHRRGHFAKECRAPRNQGNGNRDAPTRNAPVDTSTTNALIVQDGIDNSVFKSKLSETITSVPKIETNASKTSKDSLEKPKTVRFSDPIIEDWESDSEDENVFEPKEVKKAVKPSLEKIKFVNARNTTVENKNKAEKPRKFSQSLGGEFTGPKEIRLVWDNTARVNHQNKLTHPHPKRNFVPAVVLTKSGQVLVNVAKQSSHRAAASVSTARHVNTAASRPNVNNALLTTYSYFKAHSPVRRLFNQKPAAKTNNFNEKVNTTKRAKGNLIDHISKDNGHTLLKDLTMLIHKPDSSQDFDSGYSRHMTGNKSYLKDYKEIDGRFVAFGGNAKGSKITGKVFFSLNTEYVVLSPDFKLLDESQVLLKVPKNNNMYSFDLKNVVHVGGIENQMDHKVKTIRCDNETEFKNRIMNDFCEIKGTKANIDAGQARKKTICGLQYVLLPLLTSNSQGLNSSKDEVANDAGKKSTEVPRKKNGVQDPAKEGRERAQRNEFKSMFRQDNDANGNRMFTPVSAAGSTYVNLGGSIPVNATTLPNAYLPTDPLMPDLEDTADLQDTRIFSGAYDDEVEGADADFNNLELTIVVNPIPTTRIHKDHPQEQIIRDPLSAL
uniref:CCHC-type domain-containing protein n=1 Tax=Tanacetum cinerariifolium TaxID=118510 RepID=A0A6L2JS86_TANCI|nr:hypothetical protein [Tanacetum cinerariifolium]